MLSPLRLSISIDFHRLYCQMGCKPTMWHAGKELGYALPVHWKQKETEFKNNGLIYLVKDISREHSLQVTAWLLLATCSKVYNEKSGQKWDRKIWRFSSAKKGAEECLKFWLSKGDCQCKRGNCHQREVFTSHQDSIKGIFRVRSHLLKSPGYKNTK